MSVCVCPCDVSSVQLLRKWVEFPISFWSPYFRGKLPPVMSVWCSSVNCAWYDIVRCTVTQLLRLEEFNPVSTEP